jgi:hypothetical protein
VENDIIKSFAEKGALYRVVSPLGSPTIASVPYAPPLSGFDGKKIGFVWNLFTNGEILADTFAGLLKERFDHMHFVRLPSGKFGKWGEYPHEDRPEVVKNSGVDAVIALVGG